MIAPAACALASVLSSSRSNTSSGIAPTSTALSLPSRGKLSNWKETSHFKDIAAYNCVKLKICFHLVIQTKQSVTVLLSSKQDSRTCECSWFGVGALKYHVICCPESVLDISRNVLIKKDIHSCQFTLNPWHPWQLLLWLLLSCGTVILWNSPLLHYLVQTGFLLSYSSVGCLK